METNHINPQNTFDLGKIFRLIQRRWYWIVICIAVFCGLAFLANLYTTPIFRTQTSLYIKQNQEKMNSIEQFLLKQESKEGEAEARMANEIFFLKSWSLLETTLRKLDFEVSYFKKDIIYEELYKTSPVEIWYDTTSTVPYFHFINCIIRDQHTFNLKAEDSEVSWLNVDQTFQFGKVYTVNGFRFSITRKANMLPGTETYIMLKPLQALVNDYYTWFLKVAPSSEKSSILQLSLEGPTPAKDIDFLNTHAQTFIEANLREKNLATKRTSDFIDQLLESNTASLNKVQANMASFKGRNATSDLTLKAAEIQESLREFERERSATLMSVEYCNYLLQNLLQNNDIGQIVVPANVGLDNPTLTAALSALLQLQTEIKLLRVDGLSKNPAIQAKMEEITELKSTLQKTLTGLKTANQIKLKDIENRLGTMRSYQSRIPVAEQEYSDIQRNLEVNGEMVAFLMQKKADAGIARASNSSDYKVVDPARQLDEMLFSPLKNYITAIILGLFLPIVVIASADFFNRKVITKADITSATDIPLLGIIGYDRKASLEKGTFDYKSSIMTESFRSVRTNLSYFSKGNARPKVLLFISSISGEGKTFCSKYMSFILSISNKKVLLINADMRKPDGNKDLESDKNYGLSHYLSGQNRLDEIIGQTKVENLYYITAGSNPPNPAELLMMPQMKELIEWARTEYDYIIVDTPPVGVCADSIGLFPVCDLTICLIRQSYSLKSFVSTFNDLRLQNTDQKMAILFNHVDMNKLNDGSFHLGAYNPAYYNGYYGKQETKKTWWKKNKVYS